MDSLEVDSFSYSREASSVVETLAKEGIDRSSMYLDPLFFFLLCCFSCPSLFLLCFFVGGIVLIYRFHAVCIVPYFNKVILLHFKKLKKKKSHFRIP